MVLLNLMQEAGIKTVSNGGAYLALITHEAKLVMLCMHSSTRRIWSTAASPTWRRYGTLLVVYRHATAHWYNMQHLRQWLDVSLAVH